MRSICGWLSVEGHQGTHSCWADRESRKVFCLLGPKVWDAAGKVPQLVQSTACYPLLLFHTWHCNLEFRQMREIFRAQGVQMSIGSIGVQVIFSSILRVTGAGVARNRHIIQIDFWLCGWYFIEGFGFFNSMVFYYDYRLSGRDGTHLSRRDTLTCVRSLATHWPAWWGRL